MEHPFPYWSQSVLFPIPSGVVPVDSNDLSMNPKIPGRCSGASVRVAFEVSGPSAPLPGQHPSQPFLGQPLSLILMPSTDDNTIYPLPCSPACCQLQL